jgi:hypothetical protein
MPVRQLVPGSGEGPPTSTVDDERRMGEAQARMAHQRAELRVVRPLRAWACQDAMEAAVSSASGQFIPGVSSEAPGASAPLHQRGKNGSLAHATWRVRRS